MLSPETIARLEVVAAQQASYMPNQAVASQLGARNLVMFVGPAGAGKSYLMNYLVNMQPDFGRVSVFTTREPREDDEPGMFRTLPHNDETVGHLISKIEAGEVVQYAVHPTSSRLYGSEPEDYQTRYNMLAMLSGGVEQMRQLPFSSTHVIGLAVEPAVWLKRFYGRYPEASDERDKRLHEAKLSLDWLLEDEHVAWIDNTNEDITHAVQAVIDSVKYNQRGTTAVRELALAMRERLQEEL